MNTTKKETKLFRKLSKANDYVNVDVIAFPDIESIDDSENDDNTKGIEDTIIIIPEKKSEDYTQKVLELYDAMGFIYRPVRINYCLKNGEYQKDPIFRKWKQATKSLYDPNKDLFIKTGKISNLTVLDFDDLSIKEAKYLYESLVDECKLVIKTKKGFHLYFLYSPKLGNNQYNTEELPYGFDIRNEGGAIFCPPSNYADENKKVWHYEFVKYPNDNKLTNLSEEYVNFILGLGNKKEDNNKKHTKQLKFIEGLEENEPDFESNEIPLEKKKGEITYNMIKDIQVNEYFMSIIYDNVDYVKPLKKLIVNMFNGLSSIRHKNYDPWLHLGMSCFPFGELGLFLWTEFSRNSDKFNLEEINSKWKTFRDENCYDFYNIIKWLKIDNIKKFRSICKSDIYEIIKMKDKEAIEKGIEDFYKEGKATVAKFLVEEIKDDCMIIDDDYYLWDDQSKVWKKSKQRSVVFYVSNKFMEICDERIKLLIDKAKIIEAENMKRVKAVITAPDYIKSLFDLFGNLEREGVIFNENPHILNYKNGKLDLKTGAFENRDKSDYITTYIDWDYTMEKDDEVSKTLRKIFLQICNDDEELLEFMLSWFGYCMTGETKEQKWLILQGISAQNGKSTFGKFFMNALPIYSVKLDEKTFTLDYSKQHKQLIHVAFPTRFVFIEEMSQKKLNRELLKNFVDGDKINLEIMFGYSTEMSIQCKLCVTTNVNPVFECDNGTKRRGLTAILDNRFLDGEDYEEHKNEKGVYKKNTNIVNLYKDKKYLVEFVKLLQPYAQKYLTTNVLNIPPNIIKNFRDTFDENDKMLNFIEEHYIITKDDKDRVHKQTFLDQYNMFYRSKVDFIKISSDVKRHVKYDKDKTVDGRKGAIIGIKRKDNDEDLINGDNVNTKSDGNLFGGWD